MAVYTITLQSTEDYLILKKLLKAFDGAEITPMRSKKSHLDISLDDARCGRKAGPFSSVEALMSDLLD